MVPPKVSVVIPTMNEEASIGQVLDAVRQALDPQGWTYEILVVDTDSRDRTVDLSRERGARVIAEPSRGYGRAYKTGFQQALGEVIATLDADATYPADAIPNMVRLVDQGKFDFVLGDRFSNMDRRAMSLGHRVGNRVLNMTVRALFGLRMRDSQSGMWVFRRSLLERVHLTSDSMPFSEEFKIEVMRRGFRHAEVPIRYGTRLGEAKLRSWKDGWANLRFLVWKRFHMRTIGDAGTIGVRKPTRAEQEGK